MYLRKLTRGSSHHGENLSGMDLSNREFIDIDFSYVDFTDTDLRGSIFNGCDLRNADLSRTHLGATSFFQSYMCRVDFNGAVIKHTQFDWSDLSSADFSEADIGAGISVYRAIVSDATWNDAMPTYGMTGRPAQWCACDHCGASVDEEELNGIDAFGDVCDYCLGEHFTYCDDCDEYHRDSDEYHSRIHQYHYHPDWNFHGEGNTRFGLELEYFGSDRRISEVVNSADPNEDLMFCTEDSSVDIEIVTHPMTLEWFSRNFPFQVLDEISATGGETAHESGLHIHVSRSSFVNAQHILTWQLLIYRNRNKITKLARRETDRWASFDVHSEDRITTSKGERGGNRYVAINCTNSHTFELRLFRSTLDREELEAAVQFAAATVEYAKGVKSHQVIKGNAMLWSKFHDWAQTRPQYSALTSQMDKIAQNPYVTTDY